MAIDVFEKELLGLAQTAKRLPKAPSGKKLSTSTISRWASSGLIGKSEERIPDEPDLPKTLVVGEQSTRDASDGNRNRTTRKWGKAEPDEQ